MASQKSYFSNGNEDKEYCKENTKTFIVHSNENPLVINIPVDDYTGMRYGSKKFFEVEEFYYSTDELTLCGYASYGRNSEQDQSLVWQYGDKNGSIKSSDYTQAQIPNFYLREKLRQEFKVPIEIEGYNNGEMFDKEGKQISVGYIVYPKSFDDYCIDWKLNRVATDPLEIKAGSGRAQLILTFNWAYKKAFRDAMLSSAVPTLYVPFNDRDDRLVDFNGPYNPELKYTLKFKIYDCSA